MIFDRIMLPAQGRNEDYKFAQTGSVALPASVGGAGGVEPTQSWLENVIKLDPESGFLSVDDWHVKGDLVIEGQVNQWLAQQLVVDDARIQVNRRQDGAVVDSGLVIFDKDTSSEVSSLVYDVTGVWKAGGDRLFTEAYNPKLGGYAAAEYPRKAENAVITGAWTINNDLRLGAGTTRNLYTGSMRIRDTSTGAWIVSPESGAPGRWYFRPDGDAASTNAFVIKQEGVGIGTETPQERLHVAGNGLFSGAVTAGGNVGTSNFVSQMQGWRVTPQGQADFRHIYTDELQAKAFTADISQALVGSDVLTKSVAKLAQNFKIGANNTYAYLYVEELEGYPGMSVFSKWDKLRLRVFDRTGGGLVIADVWVTVTDHDINDTVNNVQRYSVRFDDDGGVVGLDVYAGSMVLDYGRSGSGVIERTVLDPQGSPYSRVSTWTGSPDNPANYTLHYQSGNLNGIPNAEGWGVYSENSFLTGKLLVGDLTKAGQYMEYKDGQLSVKGQITVTGGNAATKEDVDAVQVGGRNLWKDSRRTPTQVTVGQYGYVDGGRLLSEVGIKSGQTVTFAFSVEDVPEGEQVQARIDFYRPDDTYSTVDIRGNAVTSEGRSSFTFIVPDLTGFNRIRYRILPVNYTANYTVKVFYEKLELGNKATDWTPAPEDVPSALNYLAEAIQGSTEIEGGLINTNVLMVKDTNGAVRGGVSGLASDNVGFWTGGSYQDAINDNANVIFRKDGSFSLAGGKISGDEEGALSVDGGVVTGIIESSNYDGTVGSRFDLYNGHLQIGDAIRMSGDVSEIQVRNRDTGLDSFKIGDFPLTPTGFGGAGVDVLLSGTPVTASPASGSYQLSRTVYVSSAGALTTSTSYIDISLIVGGTYNFQTFLKVTLSSYEQVDTAFGVNLNKFEYIGGNGIKVQLKNGNTVVWQKTIFSIPEDGVIPLIISTSFQAVSPALQLIITIDGEYRRLVPDGPNTRISNTMASISRFDSSSRLVLQALLGRMEFSTKGMQAVFSSTNYFRCDNAAIEGRGIQTFISPNGTYRLRISNNGIEKSTNGGTTWTTL